MTAVAYETVEDAAGRLPLLAPMSEVAGKIATQAGAFMLREAAGRPGDPARRRARRRGGERDGDRRRRGRHERRLHRDRDGGRRLRLRPLDRPPAGARRDLRRALLDRLLDHARDRGDAAARRPGDRRRARPRRPRALRGHPRAAGADEAAARCWSTSRSTRAAASRPRSPTTHRDPTFEVDGITHYCVANMPGAVPITSTHALTNATLPYAIALADQRRGRGDRSGSRACGRASTSRRGR